MTKLLIDWRIHDEGDWHFDSHRAVHEVEHEKAEDSECETTVVQVISLMPCVCTGQDCRNDKTEHQAEQDGEDHSFGSELYLTEHEIVPDCVAEQEFADEGSKRGRKHADMQVALKIQVL